MASSVVTEVTISKSWAETVFTTGNVVVFKEALVRAVLFVVFASTVSITSILVISSIAVILSILLAFPVYPTVFKPERF